MRSPALVPFLFGLLLAGTAAAGGAGETAATPEASLRTLSEGLYLKKTVQAEQAAVRAQYPSDFGLELRPRASDGDAGIGLRIYLPTRWSQAKLRERLDWVAQSEKLRVDALEDQALWAVARDFCTYRLLRKQMDLYAKELAFLEPLLGQADQRVQQRLLAVPDRAQLYDLYLGLLNDREKVETEWIDVQRDLHRALGSQADLEAFAAIRPVAVPTQAELDELLRQALENRSDYRQLAANAKALDAAADLARAEDGFHLKYLQPSYSSDFDTGEDTWALSAAFVLPWKGRNPAVAALREKRERNDFEMALQRRIVKERLQALLQAAEAFREQQARRDRLVPPLVDQLTRDLEQMQGAPFDQLRDQLQIRRRMLDTAIQAAVAESKQERLAVDFAEELGRLAE